MRQNDLKGSTGHRRVKAEDVIRFASRQTWNPLKIKAIEKTTIRFMSLDGEIISQQVDDIGDSRSTRLDEMHGNFVCCRGFHLLAGGRSRFRKICMLAISV